mmetsp:Transcript_487/g.1344  ORF Transcript_487/g.1344 Transcript_487/m.1344 type:complete len:225 (-) Transcript_487:182-856(-)
MRRSSMASGRRLCSTFRSLRKAPSWSLSETRTASYRTCCGYLRSTAHPPRRTFISSMETSLTAAPTPSRSSCSSSDTCSSTRARSFSLVATTRTRRSTSARSSSAAASQRRCAPSTAPPSSTSSQSCSSCCPSPSSSPRRRSSCTADCGATAACLSRSCASWTRGGSAPRRRSRMMSISSSTSCGATRTPTTRTACTNPLAATGASSSGRTSPPSSCGATHYRC